MSFGKKIRRNMEPGTVAPVEVRIEDAEVVVILSDGSVVTTPLDLHPWLAAASPQQQAAYELSPFSVDWPALDEGLDLDWLQNQQNSQLA